MFGFGTMVWVKHKEWTIVAGQQTICGSVTITVCACADLLQTELLLMKRTLRPIITRLANFILVYQQTMLFYFKAEKRMLTALFCFI